MTQWELGDFGDLSALEREGVEELETQPGVPEELLREKSVS